MAVYVINDTTLTAIAAAIREKESSTAAIPVSEMAARIRAIITGIDTTDATATAPVIFNGETAYVNGVKITGTFSIDGEIETQNDLITQILAALDAKEAG